MGNNKTVHRGQCREHIDQKFLTAGQFRVSVTVNPERPKVGRNQLLIHVTDHQNQPVTRALIRAVAEMPAMGSMPAMLAPAEIQEINHGEYKGVFKLSMAGEWPLAVDVEKPGMGHGDLIFDMATGRQGLTSTVTTPEGISHYTYSMHPSVKSATPGTCPICSMGLVPVTVEELTSGSILVDEAKRQKIGVKTQIIQRQRLIQTIRAVGEVTFDDTNLHDISLQFNGWVGQLKANYIGQTIKQNQVLFTVYDPKLLSAQEEFIEAKQRIKNQHLINLAKRRLSLWGLTQDQIQQLEKSHEAYTYLPYISPVKGTLIEKNIVDGTGFKPGQSLLKIADLSQVWVEASLYEYELPLVKLSMPVTVSLADLPDAHFSGQVNWIDPVINKTTRTGRIRVVLDNSKGQLKPGMFANVYLKRDLGERLLVPEEAVLYAGETRVVFIDLGEGRLSPKRVKTGQRNGQWIEILQGLSPGDKVVTSGNFLIAAESKLKSGLDQW